MYNMLQMLKIIFLRWKEEPFDEMDSTLAVQQYIQQTIRKDPKGKSWSLIKKDLRVAQR